MKRPSSRSLLTGFIVAALAGLAVYLVVQGLFWPEDRGSVVIKKSWRHCSHGQIKFTPGKYVR